MVLALYQRFQSLAEIGVVVVALETLGTDTNRPDQDWMIRMVGVLRKRFDGGWLMWVTRTYSKAARKFLRIGDFCERRFCTFAFDRADNRAA
jgi:hypothetical protein